MAASQKTLRTCANGHEYYKSSDCPVCPICEQRNVIEEPFLKSLSAPARRALEGAGIKTPEDLTKYSEPELLKLHGLGPSSIPKLKSTLKAKGLSLKA